MFRHRILTFPTGIVLEIVACVLLNVLVLVFQNATLGLESSLRYEYTKDQVEEIFRLLGNEDPVFLLCRTVVFYSVFLLYHRIAIWTTRFIDGDAFL